MRTSITLLDPVNITAHDMTKDTLVPVLSTELVSGGDSIILTLHADIWEKLVEAVSPIVMKHLAAKMKEAVNV